MFSLETWQASFNRDPPLWMGWLEIQIWWMDLPSLPHVSIFFWHWRSASPCSKHSSFTMNQGLYITVCDNSSCCFDPLPSADPPVSWLCELLPQIMTCLWKGVFKLYFLLCHPYVAVFQSQDPLLVTKTVGALTFLCHGQHVSVPPPLGEMAVKVTSHLPEAGRIDTFSTYKSLVQFLL